MDRLETQKSRGMGLRTNEFTFQYGQIRNEFLIMSRGLGKDIYIPVWIDQKLSKHKIPRIYVEIYIPVWIDQKHIKNRIKEQE